ncbi:MAG: DEAD/DEAH box helicase, partial [Chloroflexota bacterium]
LKVEAGHLVQVSFGQQLIQGIVVALSDDPPQGVSEFKAVQALIDEQPVLTRAQLDLGYYIAHHTLAPLSDCLTLMLPPGLAKQGDTEYELIDEKFDPQSEMQFQLVKLLTERGALRGKQLERAIPKKNWRGTMTTLIKRGVIKKRAVLQPPSVRPKLIRTARSIVPTDRLAAEKLKLKYSPHHADLLDHLFSLLPGQPALDDLLKGTHSAQSDLQPLIERGWIELTSTDSVIAPTYPLEVMQKWIDKHGTKHGDAANVLRALCQNPSPIPLKSLPNATPEVIQLLNEKDLIRLSTNPSRAVLKLSGAQLTKQTQALRKPNKRVAVLDYLAKQDHAVPASWIYAETGADAATLKDLAERDLIDLGEEETIRDPLANEIFAPFDPPLLTDDQQNIWREIEAAIKFSPKTPPPFLIHGVTGSGKTEIYLRAVAATLEKKLRVLVLVPEIALTPQTVRRFAARFPNRVTVLHSELSDGQRYDMWRRARAGAVDIVIGPRSALFAPLPDIGLIIVDEEHDESYYQNDTPHYNARDVAVEYARRVNAVCLLGSATPDLVSYTKAKRGEYRLLEMPQRIMAHGEYLAQQAERLNLAPQYHSLSDTAKYIDLPEVSVVDMRQELRVGNVSIFSRALQTAMNESLEGHQQIILFLNRRGTATHI